VLQTADLPLAPMSDAATRLMLLPSPAPHPWCGPHPRQHATLAVQRDHVKPGALPAAAAAHLLRPEPRHQGGTGGGACWGAAGGGVWMGCCEALNDPLHHLAACSRGQRWKEWELSRVVLHGQGLPRVQSP
jgi:hypothetical protein